MESLRLIVCGWDDKDRCSGVDSWRSQEQTAFWKPKALLYRDRVHEAVSCSSELRMLKEYIAAWPAACSALLWVS